MRVLVTGSDGYLGSLLGPELLRRGHDVVGVDTGYYRQGTLFCANRTTPLTLSRDLRSLEEADLCGFDAVVHMTSDGTPGGRWFTRWTSARPSSSCWRHLATLCITRFSTSAIPSKITGSGRSPRSWARSFLAARSASALRIRTTAAIAFHSIRFGSICRISSAPGTLDAAPDSFTTCFNESKCRPKCFNTGLLPGSNRSNT